MDAILQKLQREFDLKTFQVENTVKLIDAGNTIPFIARYRKEMTGELDDQVLRAFYDRLTYLRNVAARKEEVRRLIDEQDKLTAEIAESIVKAETLQEIEDIYRPFRPKRRTRATVAKEKGLEPLAEILLAQALYEGDINAIAQPYVDEEKEVNSIEDALNGAMDIIAEVISDTAAYRKAIRDMTFKYGILVSKAAKEEQSVYDMYYDFKEPVAKIAKHRLLAINRGEKEEFLKVSIEAAEEKMIDYLFKQMLPEPKSITTEYVARAAEDAYKRLIQPSIEREIRNELTEGAEEQAIKVFAANLKNLLMQPPVKGKVVLGLDTAYRTGCKIAVVDETGKVLETTVVYPTPPQKKVEEAKEKLKDLIRRYEVDMIAIGNGTASKESEIFTADLIKELGREVYYMVVSEAGASVYSASKLGAEEFPDFDVALRSAVSIARRLQDPLAELVKIDPKAIGVGQYQHDMNQKRLGESLGGVVEDGVNSVGVDLNTASPSLLQYVAGVSGTVAKNIVAYREENGKFENRKQLLKVKKLGPKAFEQCAGFLRIPEGENLLDNTSVHPESYQAAEKLLEMTEYTLSDVRTHNLHALKDRVAGADQKQLTDALGIGLPTLRDIVNELLKPGRDPRDELPKPILQSEVMHLEDLKPDMVLTGTIRNVIDFGAFVDIGVHQDGLVHISQLSDRYVKHPMDVVSLGDIVKVKVLDVDVKRKRISLTMKF